MTNLTYRFKQQRFTNFSLAHTVPGAKMLPEHFLTSFPHSCASVRQKAPGTLPNLLPAVVPVFARRLTYFPNLLPRSCASVRQKAPFLTSFPAVVPVLARRLPS